MGGERNSSLIASSLGLAITNNSIPSIIFLGMII
jgi:hypothetical protein